MKQKLIAIYTWRPPKIKNVEQGTNNYKKRIISVHTLEKSIACIGFFKSGNSLKLSLSSY
jgi:hypothetical protein